MRNILVTCGTQRDEVVGRNLETFPCLHTLGGREGKNLPQVVKG